MATIPRKAHDWTFLPELGQDFSYCERCDRVRHNQTLRFYTYKEALLEIVFTDLKLETEHELKRLRDVGISENEITSMSRNIHLAGVTLLAIESLLKKGLIK